MTIADTIRRAVGDNDLCRRKLRRNNNNMEIMKLPGAYTDIRIKILIGIIILNFVLSHPVTVLKLTHLICLWIFIIKSQLITWLSWLLGLVYLCLIFKWVRSDKLSRIIRLSVCVLSLVYKFNNNLDLINSPRWIAMDPSPVPLLTTIIIMLNAWPEADAEDMGLIFRQHVH